MSNLLKNQAPAIGRAIIALLLFCLLPSCAIHTCTGEGKLHECRACLEEMRNVRGMNYLDASERARRAADRHGYEEFPNR